MMKSPLCSLLSKASWLVTALASLNQGLAVFGFDLFASNFFRNNLHALYTPLLLLIGAAGLWSLVTFFMCCKD